MWTFASSNPGWAFLMVATICSAVGIIVNFAYEAYRLRLQSKNIAAQGWPTNPELDASGSFKPLTEKPEHWRDLDKRCLDELALEKNSGKV